MRPPVARILAERKYDQALARHGEDHPETHAALGRLMGAWGERFETIFDVPVPVDSEAMTRALYRGSGVAGYKNKTWRKRVKVIGTA